MPQNVIIKRYGGSSVGWEAIYPKTTWSQIENKPTSFTPASHNHDSTYLKKAGGTMTGAITLTEQTSVWNDKNIKSNTQGSSIGFNTNGKVGIRANVTTGNEEDAIDFRVNSNTRLQLGDSKFYPTTTDTYSLGSNTNQFNNIYGKTIYENKTALSEKYAAKTHSHDYLPLAGGTLTGALQFNDSYHRISKEDGTTVARTVDSQNPVAVPANSGSKGIAIVAEENPGDYGLLYVGTDGARVVNSGDTGNNFEVYDKDSASIVFRVTQSYGDGIFKGDVYANGANGGDSSKLVTTSTLSNYVQKTIALSSESSLNNALSSGFYRLSDGHVAGFPNSNYSQMIVSRGADTVAQIGLPYSKPDIYVRSGVIGSGESFSGNWHKVTNLGLNTDGNIELDAHERKIKKTIDPGGWDSWVYSTSSYKSDVFVSAKPSQKTGYVMFGLSDNPTSSVNEAYQNINYAWYCAGDDAYIYESGSAITNTGSYSIGDEFKVQYTNGVVTYFKNGIAVRDVARSLGNCLYFKAAFYNTAEIYDVTFENTMTNTVVQGRSIYLGNGEESQFVYRTASGCEAGFYYQSTGDESVVFANEYAHAGWMFANGIRPTQTPGWQQIVTPIVHIKNGCLAINKQIAQGTDNPGYALDVNGRTKIYYSGSDTVLDLQSGNEDATYIQFSNSNGNIMGWLGVRAAHRAELVYETSRDDWHTDKFMTNHDFSVSGTTLTINIPS